MAVENVTPPNPSPPLTDPLTDLMNRTLAGNLPYASHGAGYQFLPDTPLGQIYMPGPNATLFGSNPFGLAPEGVGYFGGSYNSNYGNPRTQQANQPIGQYPNNPQQYFGGRQQQPAGQVQGPSFGQGGFPYSDFAAFQQMMGGGGTGSFYMGSYGNPYGMSYQVNPWRGYGDGSVFNPGQAQQQYAAPPPPQPQQQQNQPGQSQVYHDSGNNRDYNYATGSRFGNAINAWSDPSRFPTTDPSVLQGLQDAAARNLIQIHQLQQMYQGATGPGNGYGSPYQLAGLQGNPFAPQYGRAF